LLCMPSARSAAAKLTDFNGAWRGSGTDRATPLQSSQQTNCRATIRADETSLTDEMVCDGQGDCTRPSVSPSTSAARSFPEP
jgi:hypothetical protein